MLRYDTVIFDLDGTLTNSEKGITACAAYALKKMGREVPSYEVLRKFIGPALAESFSTYCGMDDQEAAQATKLYRERYLPIGWRENQVYPGIRALLKMLKREGARIYVATGKPQDPSERILNHFRLMQYIDGVAGSLEDAPYGGKENLIARVLDGKHYEKAVMIGDRSSDIIGARKAGIDGIGAGYGFGEKDEFDALHCPVAASVEDLSVLLMDMPLEKKGYFISIEGLDGCGKTTQSNAIAAALSDYGYIVRRTREPGGCPISEKIRDLLLDVENTGMSDITEALLYASSRAQHVRQVIIPAINAGEVVLCDRFVDSSVAFQGGGRQLGVSLIQQINAPAVDGCLPDTTVFLRLDHETALKRRENASALDRIESEKASFHARVEQAYNVLLQQDPERFIVADARRKPEEITECVLNSLFERMDAAEVL
ncbi:MAG: dTMP kinase [Clostridia bacterium]|nr:dTMP kinase [Clostridia bacterium]